MKVTIVTTTYNHEKYIAKAIDSFLIQKTNFPFKILISDDKSTDKTAEILKEYQNKYPEKIEIINHETNLGAMGNFIDTLSRVKDTEYVALCDGDDYWTDENKLQKQVEFLDNHKDFTICFHPSRMFFENGEKQDEILSVDTPEVTTLTDLVKWNYIIANSVVYRWKFNDTDLRVIFPENIVPGDYYIHLLHAKTGKIKKINEVMSDYRKHEAGFWYSNAYDKDTFSLKYGKKFLNFYHLADEQINLPKEAFLEQRKDIIYNMIIAFVKNGKIEDLKLIQEFERDEEVYYMCLLDIVNRNIEYLDMMKNSDTIGVRQELEQCKSELAAIHNSRIWKLRNKIIKYIRKE